MAWLSSIIIPLLLCSLATSYTNVVGVKNKFDIGVCYGFNGDNLPSPVEAVKAYQQYGIENIRLFEPNLPMLDALKGSGIVVVLGVKNQDIPTLAASEEAAEQWFATYVEPYVNDMYIIYITVGNEVVPGQFSDGIAPAIQNLQNVLLKHGYPGMRVSTVVSMNVLTNTYPPSAATFTEEAKPYMIQILKQLDHALANLFINVYPYFAYASDPTNVRLDYAQFTATQPVVQDGNLTYMNLLDAMVDSFIWAMEKAGFYGVYTTVSETGWPHAGNGNFTTVDLAMTYNKNFMNHMLSRAGTPKRPGGYPDGFIFSMIDENLKSAGVEQNFGMFMPNLEPHYNIFD